MRLVVVCSVSLEHPAQPRKADPDILNRIESIDRNRVYIGKALIPVGDTYREEFFRRMEG